MTVSSPRSCLAKTSTALITSSGGVEASKWATKRDLTPALYLESIHFAPTGGLPVLLQQPSTVASSQSSISSMNSASSLRAALTSLASMTRRSGHRSPIRLVRGGRLPRLGRQPVFAPAVSAAIGKLSVHWVNNFCQAWFNSLPLRVSACCLSFKSSRQELVCFLSAGPRRLRTALHGQVQSFPAAAKWGCRSSR